MRNFINIVNESVYADQVMAFFDYEGVSPDDVGREEIDGNILYFEGFTDLCWNDAQEKGKTIETLQKEIVEDWASRLAAEGKPSQVLDWGWMYEPEFFEDNIFWAIYRIAP